MTTAISSKDLSAVTVPPTSVQEPSMVPSSLSVAGGACTANHGLGSRLSTSWKLRASYGSAGNRPSELYPQYDLYSIESSYNAQPGMLISQIGNNDLTWERTYTAGMGLTLRSGQTDCTSP